MLACSCRPGRVASLLLNGAARRRGRSWSPRAGQTGGKIGTAGAGYRLPELPAAVPRTGQVLTGGTRSVDLLRTEVVLLTLHLWNLYSNGSGSPGDGLTVEQIYDILEAADPPTWDANGDGSGADDPLPRWDAAARSFTQAIEDAHDDQLDQVDN